MYLKGLSETQEEIDIRNKQIIAEYDTYILNQRLIDQDRATVKAREQIEKQNYVDAAKTTALEIGKQNFNIQSQNKFIIPTSVIILTGLSLLFLFTRKT